MEKEQHTTTTRLVRALPEIRAMIESGPVTVTNHGRTEFVMLSADEYERLKGPEGISAGSLDAKLRVVLDSINTSVVITDCELRLKRTNRAFCDIVQMENDELVGRVLDEVRDTPVFRFVSARARLVIRRRIVENFKINSTIRKGRLLSVKISPWPGGVAIFVQDSTAEVDASDRQIRDSAIDGALAHVGRVGIGFMHRTGEIVRATKSLAGVLGIDGKSLSGANFLATVSPRDRDRISTYLRSDPGESLFCVVDLLYHGTDEKTVTLSITPYIDSEANLMFALIIETA